VFTVTTLIVAVFILTYLGMAAGRVPGLKIDRTGIALLGLVVLLAAGSIKVEDIGRAVDAPTILLLFALMIISAQFGAAGFYDWCAARITATKGSPRILLAITVLVSGALSAVLANDIVVFAMTPLLCRGLLARNLDPRPFLIALACASNAGSAATVIGNPQNILIGQSGGLNFWHFLLVCGPPALMSLGIVIAVIWIQWRGELRATAAPSQTVVPKLDIYQTDKGLLAVLMLVVLFTTDLPRETGALVIAAMLLLSRRLSSRAMVGAVDWHLLLLFACLFTITSAFASTGHTETAFAWLAAKGLLPDRLSILAPLTLVASNTIGNVPAVILLLTAWPNPSPQALYGLALLSTLAGNLLIVGSLANIIVAERAASIGVKLRFLDHARSGIPITLLSMGIACLWLWLLRLLPW
jgi:Na+/H+ antiporter NhaD/arsenite permease-like protein